MNGLEKDYFDLLNETNADIPLQWVFDEHFVRIAGEVLESDQVYDRLNENRKSNDNERFVNPDTETLSASSLLS